VDGHSIRNAATARLLLRAQVCVDQDHLHRRAGRRVPGVRRASWRRACHRNVVDADRRRARLPTAGNAGHNVVGSLQV